jgi:hypothetical protein
MGRRLFLGRLEQFLDYVVRVADVLSDYVDFPLDTFTLFQRSQGLIPLKLS